MLTKAFFPCVSPKNVECALRELVTEDTLCPRADDALLQAKNYANHKAKDEKLNESTWFFYILPQESHRSIYNSTEKSTFE